MIGQSLNDNVSQQPSHLNVVTQVRHRFVSLWLIRRGREPFNTRPEFDTAK